MDYLDSDASLLLWASERLKCWTDVGAGSGQQGEGHEDDDGTDHGDGHSCNSLSESVRNCGNYPGF